LGVEREVQQSGKLAPSFNTLLVLEVEGVIYTGDFAVLKVDLGQVDPDGKAVPQGDARGFLHDADDLRHHLID
jgi:hypothetical protein